MKRFYLHQIYGDRRVEDREGYSFADLADAWLEATLSARQIVGDSLVRGGLPDYGRIEIADEDGRTLGELQFIDALGLPGCEAPPLRRAAH